MPSTKMSPVVAKEKPRRRMSSSPPSAARKVTPAVLCSTSFRVSRLRSSISFSVTTVTDWGMSRSSCLPLPMLVVVVRRLSLPSGASAFSSMVTGLSDFTSACFTGWAIADMEPAKSMAPRGKSGVACIAGVRGNAAGLAEAVCGIAGFLVRGKGWLAMSISYC